MSTVGDVQYVWGSIRSTVGGVQYLEEASVSTVGDVQYRGVKHFMITINQSSNHFSDVGFVICRRIE